MPALRFAVMTKLDNPNGTIHVVFPALLGSPITRHIDEGSTDQGAVRYDESVNSTRQVSVAGGESNLERLPGDTVASNSPTVQKAFDSNPSLNHPMSGTVPAQPAWNQMKRRVDEMGQCVSRFVIMLLILMNGTVRQFPANLPPQVSASHEEYNPQHDIDDSISWAIRTRRQPLRRDPYPTRSKRLPQSSRTSQNDSSQVTGSSNKQHSSYTRSSMSTSVPTEPQPSSSTTVPTETQPSSSSSTSNKCIVKGKLMTQSPFGYTAFDYHQRKVKYKDAYTSWYTYSTAFPIDSPPELPKNAMGLQHDVLFLHINEAERVKYHKGQLSKLLMHCVRFWIWDSRSLKWEKIAVGEKRVVNGYKLCLSIGYIPNIHPQWVVPKSMQRLIAENS
ncbi:hypothetical protein F5880DRAFT_1618767 [Lentinula raphanica]|nr:hypothetical protein F5880DRAFT_1618767 [Lentinula raphanica]